jgi:DNA-binding transcriptional ArsR family regulator
MPELPIQLQVNTAQQFKALGDPIRERIISIIQHQPATAKQIATRLKIAPGTIGHHLQVLETAGLVQVVARRIVHGIVAKYYTRTARIFCFDFSSEVVPENSYLLNFLTLARSDLSETLASYGPDALLRIGLSRARISQERAQHYQERALALLEDFLREPNDPEGEVYTMPLALFKAPPYQQNLTSLETDTPHSEQPTELPHEEDLYDN